MNPTPTVPQPPELCVEIMRFVDDRFPGWVECEFEDAMGIKHVLVDKVPIFTERALDSNSPYPQTGTAPCKVLARWKDSKGRELVRITTLDPAGIESTQGISEFIVTAPQVRG